MSKARRFDWLFRPRLSDEDQPLSAEARFAEALAELPAVERSALALSEIGGLDTDEIAELLETEPVVVQDLLSRARDAVRVSLSTHGRRGLAAILPVQSLWQVGSSAPVVRAAGVIAATIVAPTVLTGGGVADAPRAAAAMAEPPRARLLDRAERPSVIAEREVPVRAATSSPVRPARRAAPVAGSESRSVRPGPGLHRDRDAAVAAPTAQQPPSREPAALAPERPPPPVDPPVGPPVEPPPLPVEPPPLPVEPPALPVDPPALPAPPLPPLPLPPALPLPLP